MHKIENNGKLLEINSDSFLFSLEETINIFELEELKTNDIDDVLFNDFKNKLGEEKIDFEDFEDFFDDDQEDIDIFNEDKKSDKHVMSKIPLEQAVEDFTDGISDAFDFIYSHYKPILTRWGKRYNNEELGIELLDIVLLSAVKTFNCNAGAKFNTYFWKCAQNYVNCNRKKNDAQKRAHNKNMASLNEKRMYKGDSTEMELEKVIEDKSSTEDSQSNELILSIKSLGDCLKETEISILLKLIDNYTLQEIGDDLGVTAAAICMSLKRIAKKPVAAKKLKEILTTR